MKNITNKLFIVLTLAMGINIVARSNEERGGLRGGLRSGYTGEESRGGLLNFPGKVVGGTAAVPATVVGADTRYNSKKRKSDYAKESKKSNKRKNKKNRENFDQ